MSVSSGVFEFIQQQSPLFVNKLYGNTDQESGGISQAAWVCRGVLQSLCPLAKSYVMRLLFIEAAISSVDIIRWCEADQRAAHNSAIRELLLLRIFTEVDIPENIETQSDEQWYILNKYFRNSLKFGIVHLSRPWLQEKGHSALAVPAKTEAGNPPLTESGKKSGGAEEIPPTLKELEEFSFSRWNTILEFLVSCDVPI